MRRHLAVLAACTVLAAFNGCSGSNPAIDGGSGGGNGGGLSTGGGGNGGGVSTGGGGGAAGGGVSTGGGTAGGGAGGGTSAGGGTGGGGLNDAGCPDESGSYTIALMGAGCGDTSAGAPECLTQTGCALTLTSSGAAGSGLNGTVNLDDAGTFSNGAVREGTGNRTGCVGTWAPGTSTLTVDCGGVGTSQSCVTTLSRTSATCM
jgi:hypothetical protein